MQYILFHKNKKIANVEFTESGIYERVNGYYNEELMPPGTRYVNDAVIHQRFATWLEDRFFAQNRTNRTRVLNLADCVKVEQLINKGYGLSLNDGYWFKKAVKSDLKPFWEDINFFDNPDNGFVSNILLFNKVEQDKVNFLSPDLTTPGNTDKAWFYENGKYILYKIGDKKYDYVDVFNDLISDELCKILNITPSNYSIVELKEGVFFTKSECFTSKDIEYFPFSTISTEKNTVGKNGILSFVKENNLKSELDKYIVHDYILSVTDRNFTNIGFLRDANTFEVLSLAPMHGSGHCLWYDYKEHGIGVLDEAKTFDSSHAHQVNLVDNFDFIDFEKLSLFPSQILYHYKNSLLPENVIRQIVEQVKINIENISKIANKENVVEEIVEEKIERKTSNSGITLSQMTTGGFGFGG